MKLSLATALVLTTSVALAQPTTTEPTTAPDAGQPPIAPTEPAGSEGTGTTAAGTGTTGTPGNPTTVPDATPPVVTPKPTEAPSTEPPKKLAVGKAGLFQPGALLQGWFLVDHSSASNSPYSTFRLRRAELSAKGEIVPKQVAYKVMFDPAKVRETSATKITDASGATVTVQNPTSRISVLQDFEITALTEYADITVGQFKIPVSWEGYNSSAKILFPERAFVSTTYGDARDLGAKVTKTMEHWGYYLGIFNGSGLNNLDANNQKDVAVRLEVYPVKGLTIAGVAYDSIGSRHRTGTKDRWEGDVRYESGPLLLQAEYIRARDCTAADCASSDDFVTAQGFYAAAGYTIGKLQPVARVGFLDPDANKDLAPMTSTDKDELWHYDIGVNYYLQSHEMKLQASYQRQQFDNKSAIDEVIVGAQVWY